MRPGDENAKADVDSGDYERHYQIQPGDTVLDIGAHIGFFTERAANAVGPTGKVIAFEPHPDNFVLLCERMVLQEQHNIKVIKAAVSNMAGKDELWQLEGNTGGHSIFPCPGKHKNPLPVELCLCQQYIPEGRHVRFVKCDAEGAEFQILKGLLPALKAPVDIAFEAHSEELYLSCKVLLKSHGFQFEPDHVKVGGVCWAWKEKDL